MKNSIYLFPAALAVLFMSSLIIIVSPVGNQTIVPVPKEISTTISPLKVLEIVSNLPEVRREDLYLTNQGSDPLYYIESHPSGDNSNFQVFYGETTNGQEQRLATFLVDSVTGKVSVTVKDIGETISYQQWQKTCNLHSCKNQ